MASTNKLYPPIIDGVLPAFCKSNNIESNKNWQIKIVIPFSMNQMVGINIVKSMFLRLKTVQTNDVKYCKPTKYIDLQKCTATFYLTENEAENIQVGLFYKAQLAYCAVEANNAQISNAGYFSTIGIIKCIAKPTVSIAGFKAGKVNFANNRYLGLYAQDINAGDFNEKVYSYKFIINDDNNQEYITSGVQLHNVNNDTNSWTSQDEFIVYKIFEPGKLYYIQYSVTTVNGIELSSPYYRVMAAESVPMEKMIEVLPKLNYDEGYIEINFHGPQKYVLDTTTNTVSLTNEEYCSGLYLLSRGYIKDNYMVWDEIARFNLHNELPSKHIERDFTIEQGITYKYRLQQYNSNGVYSQPSYSKEIYADFEDMFLYDGTRQLKVRFNPKISSFKVDIPEQKLETIGSKYPFIFRNGNVYYHEFPVSGLISYQLDEAKLFLNEEEIIEGNVLEKNTITRFGYQPIVQNQVRLDKDLTSDNMMSERYFKLKVLEWLTNGEIKLFRSPGEGNYLVRLLNTSMTPNDTLGRMLHTFTTTAYEIDDLTYDNLLKYHMISIAEPDTSVVQLTTIKFTPGAAGSTTIIAENLNDQKISGFEIDGCMPGDQIIIKYADDQSPEIITIGVTGSYHFTNNERPIESISFIPFTSNTRYPHQITLQYKGIQQHYFDLITNVTSETIVGRTYYGPQTDIINTVVGEDDSFYKVNIKIGKNTETYKTKLLNMEKLHIIAREIIPLYRWKNNGSFVYNTTPFGVGYPINELDSMLRETRNILGDLVIFKIYQQNSDYDAPVDKQHLINNATKTNGTRINYEGEASDKYFYEIYPDWKFIGYWDRHYSIEHFMPSAPDMRFGINKTDNGQIEYIELKDEREITLTDLGPINTLYLGSGLIAEIIMRIQVLDYSIEDTDNNVANAKTNYLNAHDAVTTAFNNYVENYNSSWSNYQTYLRAKAAWDAAQEVIQTLDGQEGAIQIARNLLENVDIKAVVIDQLTTSITDINKYINQFWTKLNNYQENNKIPSGVVLPETKPATISTTTKNTWINNITNATGANLLNTIKLILNNPDSSTDLSDYFNTALNIYDTILTNYNNNIPTIYDFTDILPQEWLDRWGIDANKTELANEILNLLHDKLIEMYNTLRFAGINSHSFNSNFNLFKMPWSTTKSNSILNEQTNIAGITRVSYDTIIPDQIPIYNNQCVVLMKYAEYINTIEALTAQSTIVTAKTQAYGAAKTAFDIIYSEQIETLLTQNEQLNIDNQQQQQRINAANSLKEGLLLQEPQDEDTAATIAFLDLVISTAQTTIDRNNETIRINNALIAERQNKASYITALNAKNNAYIELCNAQEVETTLRNRKNELDIEVRNAIDLWNNDLTNIKSYLYILEHFDTLWSLTSDQVITSINNYNTWYAELRSFHANLMSTARDSLNLVKQTRTAYEELNTKIDEWVQALEDAKNVTKPSVVNQPTSMDLTTELNNKKQAWEAFITALRLSYWDMEARYAK